MKKKKFAEVPEGFLGMLSSMRAQGFLELASVIGEYAAEKLKVAKKPIRVRKHRLVLADDDDAWEVAIACGEAIGHELIRAFESREWVAKIRKKQGKVFDPNAHLPSWFDPISHEIAKRLKK